MVVVFVWMMKRYQYQTGVVCVEVDLKEMILNTQKSSVTFIAHASVSLARDYKTHTANITQVTDKICKNRFSCLIEKSPCYNSSSRA